MMNTREQDVETGIRKIYMAEFLRIVAAVISIGCACLVPFIQLDGDEISTSTFAIAMVASILVWPALILGIYALFVNLSGIFRLSKHNKRFKNGFIVALVAILLSVISGVITATTSALSGGILSTAASVAYLSVMLSVMGGSVELANDYRDESLSVFERKIRIPMLVLIIVYVVGSLVVLVPAVSESYNVASVVSIAASAVALVVDIMYLKFLAKARNIFGVAGNQDSLSH